MFSPKWTHFACDSGVYSSGEYERATLVVLHYASEYTPKVEETKLISDEEILDSNIPDEEIKNKLDDQTTETNKPKE